MRFTGNTHFPICSWRICWRAISVTKRIWSTNCLIPVKRDWPESFLLLAHFGKDGVPETVVPKISQETLAEMIGTTRSRVSFFMNRFRKLGFIHYNGGLQVHSSLLNVVLHD